MENLKKSVSIVGAGSMGIITGYNLQLAGADITYLIRPKNLERLSKTQKLYSYDDNSVKDFSGYDIIIDPSNLGDKAYDFVIITLDGASLMKEDGLRLVDEIGKNFKNTSAGIILGSIGIDNKKWFIERSGLNEDQVISGGLSSLIYETTEVTLPSNPEVDDEAVSQSDYGYRNVFANGFMIENSAEKLAEEFVELYNKNGVNTCAVIPESATKLFPTHFAMLAAWEILNWPSTDNIDPNGEIWQLGTEAMKEFQRLSIFGQAGIDASNELTAEGLLAIQKQTEKDTWPLNLAEFNRYHHGKKVNFQDHQILRGALELGKAEGIEMPAMTALVSKLK